ncbi:YrhB domain-containing protein [Colwellia psychrerythraea]|uniref:Immunity protein 35 domain-containing protein n=1 Tax=Colwellia psychrerythraea TaxID=28229 RepID=A0A099KHG3_COLPS|nr:YrhB domain-containing protein [Colwellia psychrerythraea]KGJ89680.1 hypothetical protein ND2E_3871 [Colwellia psychrerythraea]
MNLAEAEKLVLSEIEDPCISNDIECGLLKGETIEKDWGWVFFYQSTAFLNSGDFRDMVGGNAPIIVNKHTGKLIHTGTTYEIDHYIKEYEGSL